MNDEARSPKGNGLRHWYSSFGFHWSFWLGHSGFPPRPLPRRHHDLHAAAAVFAASWHRVAQRLQADVVVLQALRNQVVRDRSRAGGGEVEIVLVLVLR